MTAGLLLDDKNENDINSGGSEGASDNSVQVGGRYLIDKFILGMRGDKRTFSKGFLNVQFNHKGLVVPEPKPKQRQSGNNATTASNMKVTA